MVTIAYSYQQHQQKKFEPQLDHCMLFNLKLKQFFKSSLEDKYGDRETPYREFDSRVGWYNNMAKMNSNRNDGIHFLGRGQNESG